MPIVNSLTVHTGTYTSCAPTTMTTLRHAWDRTVYNAYMFYVTSTDCHAGLCMYDDSFTGYPPATRHVTPCARRVRVALSGDALLCPRDGARLVEVNPLLKYETITLNPAD